MGALDIINALMGRSALESDPSLSNSGFSPASKPSSFPSKEDADYARKYGFGYGGGQEAFLNNEAARVHGDNRFEMRPVASKDFATYAAIPKFKPSTTEGMSLSDATSTSDKSSKNLDLTSPDNKGIKEKLEDVYMRAALTANRIPVAGLGFEPRKMVSDVVIEGNPNFNGAYNPNSDEIYFNTARERQKGTNSTPVHESIHRGIQMLRKNPEAQDVFKNLPKNEEYIVRWLMASQAGNPEVIGLAPNHKWPEYDTAKDVFGGGKYDKEIQRLNDIAAKEIAKRKPGGPN